MGTIERLSHAWVTIRGVDVLELCGEFENRYVNLYIDVRHSRKPVNRICWLV